MAKDETIHFVTPIDWIYYFSNHLNKICEVFNYEYIDSFSKYLSKRILTLWSQENQSIYFIYLFILSLNLSTQIN